jgi:hypothetical protein
MTLQTWQHRLLPLLAQELLRDAARTDGGIPFGESFTRTRAVTDAIRKVQQRHPQLFRDQA